MKNDMIICFAADNNYAPYMGIAILSVLLSAKAGENFHFYILDNKISEVNKQKILSLQSLYPFKITWLDMNSALFEKCDTKHANWTLSIFGRYLIPVLIPEDKVLYLDCDIMVRGSLQPLWDTDLSGFYLAGVPDYNVIYRGNLRQRFGETIKEEEYVNSGVLLINNKKWREENLFQTLLDYSIQNAAMLQWPDQDSINFICRKRKKLVPERWNVMGYFYKPDLFPAEVDAAKIQQETEACIIRHFHPWKKNFFIPHREEYLKLMEKSPWADLLPKDDAPWLAWSKMVWRYLWRHPFCFLLPKFYKRWKMRGTKCLFVDY